MTQDLMDWMYSTISISSYSDGHFRELYDYFESIRLRDGAIRIPKEAGLFICAKNDIFT